MSFKVSFKAFKLCCYTFFIHNTFQIHILKLLNGKWQWSTPLLSFLLDFADVSSSELLPGRCHRHVVFYLSSLVFSSCLVGENILCFGGSASTTNIVACLNIAGVCRPSNTPDAREDEISVSFPPVIASPSKRTSSAAVMVGKYFLVYGGFHLQDKELGDVWVSSCSSAPLLICLYFF